LQQRVDRAITIDGGQITSDGPFPVEAPLPQRKTKGRAADSAPLVDLREVSFAYPEKTPVLKQATMQLRAGEVVALVGPNGSGKTTLLKLLCGLLQPTVGCATIAGHESPMVADLVGSVGFLFQNPDEQLFADTVWEEIHFGLKSKAVPMDVERCLEHLGLARYRDEHPRSLSRGERQRLAAATLLIHRPKLILLDEPTTGLDRRHWVSLMEIVTEEARRSGAGVVFSTHHSEVVDAFADRVWRLSNGALTVE
jgi:energy-coupling factor transporter ATP-binding protein EcfA2